MGRKPNKDDLCEEHPEEENCGCSSAEELPVDESDRNEECEE